MLIIDSEPLIREQGLIDIQNEMSFAFSSIEQIISDQEKSILSQMNAYEKLRNSEEDSSLILYENTIIETFKRWNSFANCITVFAIYEGALDKISKHLEKNGKFKIKLNDLNKGKYYENYWIYLTKVCSVDLENFKVSFNFIIQQAKVRHVIMHRGGIINKDTSVDTKDGLTYVPYDEFYKILDIKASIYTLKLIENMKGLLNSILKKVDEHLAML